METILPALEHDCPFCHAVAGQPCRARTSGREKDRPHSQRTALARPEERTPAPRVEALCCVCGQRRTVSVDYSRPRDPNYAWSPLGQLGGWRFTQTLKCSACGEQTRHAVLRPGDAPYRDSDEERQRIALGDPDTGRYGHLTDLARIRREYREMPFPRNPYLMHRRFTDDAQRAWDDGTKMVTALCGEQLKIERDPRETQKYSTATRRNEDGYLIAEVVSDIEITDHETGLSWIDMDCVDCCRVSNRIHLDRQRQRLELFFAKFAVHPELVPENRIGQVVKLMEDLYGSDETPYS